MQQSEKQPPVLLAVGDNPTGGVDLAIGQHRLWLSDEDAARLLLLLAQRRERKYRRLAKQRGGDDATE
jgi:hypothetical protein